jgi:tyrosyl-DNA phosphodiesterase 2
MDRQHSVPVGTFDATTQRWTDGAGAGPVDCAELTLSTFNIWFRSHSADERYRAIADLLSRKLPDVMVFQEVTPSAAEIFLAQPWIRQDYARVVATGGANGNYGMLMLSRLPVSRASYRALPTRASRGFLTAELNIDGGPLTIGSIHLDSGQSSWWMRAWQLRRIFRVLRGADNVVLAGDFNMRDSENRRIGSPYRDLWPELRPDDPGFTEDTSINLMRLDIKKEPRQVRFDRVLLKGAAWSPTSIELLGTEPISPSQPRIFPSDHFGLQCHLTRTTHTKGQGHA